MRNGSYGVLALALAASSVTQAQIVGRVTDARRAPLQGVEVQLVIDDSVHRAIRTDSSGSFALMGASGPATLRARLFGFRPRSMSVDARERREVAIVLEPMPAELEQIKVVGRIDDSRGRLREFYMHREQAKFGRFFDRDDIESKRPRRLSELMRFVPGAQLKPGRLGSIVRLRGCRPLLWIDGIRVPGAELDESVNMDDVEAVEVYSSFAGIPAQYVDRNTNCGAVVVWLKG